MKSQSEFEQLKEKERLLREAARAVSVQESELPRVIERFKREIEEMKSKASS